MRLYAPKLRLLASKPLLVLLVLAPTLIAGVAGQLLPNSKVVAATSTTINFQARLMNAAGAIAPDGDYNVEFKLYSAAAVDGGETPIQGSCTTNPGAAADEDCEWVETRTGGNKVHVANGYVTVQLGSVTAFPATINWDQQLWLTMNIGGTGTPVWDGEMSPRLKLTAVPYAFRAGQLASLAGSYTGILQFAASLNQDSTITLPDPGAASATVCYQNSTDCGFVTGAGTEFIQNQNASAQTTADFWISGTGRADTALQTPLLDTGSAGVLAIGTTNATAINLNQNTTVAAAKTLTVTSGATSLTGAATGDALTVSNSTSTGNIALFKDNTTTVLTIADGGAATFSNSADSAGALTVKNSGGGNVLAVNTTDSGPSLSVGRTSSAKRVATALSDTYAGVSDDTRSFTFAKDVPAGHTLIGTLALSSTSTTAMTFLDTANNAGWAIDASVSNGSTVTTYIFSTVVTNPITAGDTLDIDLVSGTGRWLINIEEFGNVLWPSARDVTATGTGSSTSLSAGTTAATAQANELVFGAYGFSSGRVFTPGSGFMAATQLTTTGGSNDRSLASQWRYVTAVGAQTAPGTLDIASAYAGVIATYKVAAPAASAQGGSIQLADTAGTGYAATLQVGTLTANQAIFLPDESGTICIQGSVNCGFVAGEAADFIQNQNASAQTTANFWISGTGRADVALQTPLLDTASAGTLAIGTTNATAINLNQNTTLAAGKTLTVTSALTILTGATSGDALQVSNSTSTGNIAVFRDNATDVFVIGDGGAVTLQNETNQLSALEILTTTASGSNILFNADTINERVGIGGVAGLSKFEVQGGDAAIYNSGGNPRLILGDSTTAGQHGFLQWDSTNDYFRIEKGGTNGLKINDNYVSIGNIFPGQPLTVGNGSTSLFQIDTSGMVTQIGGQTRDITTADAATATSLVLQPGTSSGASANGPAVAVRGGNASGTTSVTGGAVTIQGGNATGASGTRNGGSVTIDAGTGATANGSVSIGTANAVSLTLGRAAGTTTLQGTVIVSTVGAATANTAALCRDSSTGNLISCDANTTGRPFLQNGNTFGAAAVLGTNDANNVQIETNNTIRATFDNSNSLYLGLGVTNAAPSGFTVRATGSSTTGVAGASLTLQGGNATVGNADGGNLNLNGGSPVGTGATGLVVLNTPTFQTSTTQTCDGTSNPCAITQSSIDGNGAVVINATAAGLTITMPNPTINTNGRIVYVTAANGSLDFTLSVNGGGTGNLIAMRGKTTATMIWGPGGWTAAGASSSTTLQAAYDNTLTSAGGAELVLSNSSNANGLTIRDSSSNPVNGTLLEVQSSSAASLFSVNGTVTDYASNGGVESNLGSEWAGFGTGASVTRNTTSTYITNGTGSARIATTGTADTGARNTLNAALTPNLRYNVSFAARRDAGSTASFTDLTVYYSNNGTNTSVACTNYSTQTIPTSVWTKVNCTFVASSSGITTGNAILIRQTAAATRTWYVDNVSVTISADLSYATDGSVNDAVNFGTNWVTAGLGTVSVTRNTSTGNDASDSAQVQITAGAANAGVRNRLSINPLTNTLYRITAYVNATASFTDFKVRYSPIGSTTAGGTYVDCVDYNTQTISTATNDFTKVTCYINTGATAVTTPYVYFVETASATRTFYVDTFSMVLASSAVPNVQIGGGVNGGPTTLFTLDRGASAPIASDNDALLGSMYYDTTLGKLQCYEADGWGACGSSPDNIVTISPEYTNAVLNGTGVGTMTSDLCSDGLNINDGSSGQPTICGTNETFNFYKWTSPQASAQTYSIYVTYQLPATFKTFQSSQTSIMGRTDSSNSTVQYSVYRNSSSGLAQCGSTVSVSTGSVSSWQTGQASGAADPSTCGFSGGDSIVFKIDVIASQNANAYVGNLNFTFTNQ